MKLLWNRQEESWMSSAFEEQSTETIGVQKERTSEDAPTRRFDWISRLWNGNSGRTPCAVREVWLARRWNQNRRRAERKSTALLRDLKRALLHGDEKG